MSGASSLDIRLPIGGLFTLLGLIIAGYGLVTAGDEAQYARSGGININLWWGLVMLVFGAVFLWLGRHGTRPAAPRPALETPEGLATEAREHRLGLERE
jgi:hypothetical protein